MTGDLILDWAATSVSLFNALLLLWLGLTVWLNAERRTVGIWLASAGLASAAVFFVCHSVLLGIAVQDVSEVTDFWWHLAWIPVIVAPLTWYLVMLWYAGYWERSQSPLRRRQQVWSWLVAALTPLVMLLVLFANPFPSFRNVLQLRTVATPSISGVPIVIPVYVFFNLICIVLALDAVRRPEASGRLMGDIARARARPWLVAGSGALLVVGLLVGWVVLWITMTLESGVLTRSFLVIVEQFDLAIAALIAASIVLLGQAIVSYEIFAAKSLPRQGLLRHWRNAVILAAGYSVLAGLSLTFPFRPIYGILLSLLVIAIFYALLSWRDYAERNRYIQNLRPFVSSQRLYESLLERGAIAPEVDARTPFYALCESVLGARLAYLLALGPLAPLAGPPLIYPPGLTAPDLPIQDLVPSAAGAPATPIAVDPARCAGAVWAVPLLSERGLIGMLFLGPKADGTLYVQEEIEIARASAERLIDTQATVEMARRLMALERQRLAESLVLDRQTRRVLHDDVLPNVHTAILTLGAQSPSGGDTVLALLGQVHRQISNLLRELPAAAPQPVQRLGLIGALRQCLADEFSTAFDQVTWMVEPEAATAFETLPPLSAEVLYYAAREAIRNAARHGRSDDISRPLRLCIQCSLRPGLEIRIDDDGVGLGLAAQTRRGAGQGLALHSTMMAVIGGELQLQTTPEGHTQVALKL